MVTPLEQHYIDNGIKYGFIQYKNKNRKHRGDPYIITRCVPKFVVVKQSLEKRYKNTIISSRIIKVFNQSGKQTDTLLEMFVLTDNKQKNAKRVLYSVNLDFLIEKDVVFESTTRNKKLSRFKQQCFKWKYKDEYAEWSSADAQKEPSFARKTNITNTSLLAETIKDVYKEILGKEHFAVIDLVANMFNQKLIVSISIPVVTLAGKNRILRIESNNTNSKVEVTVN